MLRGAVVDVVGCSESACISEESSSAADASVWSSKTIATGSRCGSRSGEHEQHTRVCTLSMAAVGRCGSPPTRAMRCLSCWTWNSPRSRLAGLSAHGPAQAQAAAARRVYVACA
jgi:hypothetical protein